ncbi:phosphoglucomutase/phosphomannomutase, C-terminal domain protein [Chlamydia ibidis]|uniref:Phosphoglucomutase/phosphomannomutase, C-terminal domain protein n=2 Tax=Chlamydia ibidis TaxID=1405396 RepID=S7J2V6_9CHLA|nr:phospho-sugar mutase [Chlamydia ibidis]EPP34347.1 phosphoglucomutase/phosphomannomutase, C-terminal domain protein [Chlamydia ibidis]EQM63224.1 phosphoglucomutase/phosphomannomutase, C-terminal domain protein [Chlamydia ibidis 10-1398/6]
MDQMKKKIKSLYSSTTATNIIEWLSRDCTRDDHSTILELLENDPKRLEDLFSKTLVFGTGGLRSIMGIGTNRMNSFTVKRVTQGLAEVLHKHNPHPGDNIRVIIGYDTRNNSYAFAQDVAKVLAGNHIEAFLFSRAEPLALVSFAVRSHSALAGIMITASHNPPEYNGYKVYMRSGGQVLPPLDREIVEQSVSVNEILSVDSLKNKYIHFLGEECEQSYRDVVCALQLCPEDNRLSGRGIKVSYSPLHGTGVSLIPHVLKDWGFSQVYLVEQQSIPDGNFPTVVLPNPEDPQALTLGIKQMMEKRHDLFIATDPDADRIGVVSREENGFYIFNGNQIACLLADHILSCRSKKHPLDKQHKVVKSLVTTEMLTKITEHYGADIVNVGTGFKYIGEKIESWRNTQYHYIFGAEESHGYLYGTHVEDKDGISSSALVAEAALQCKLRGDTLRGALLDLYERHGYFINKTESLSLNLSTSSLSIQDWITSLENQDNRKLYCQGRILQRFENYRIGRGFNLETHESYDLTLPKLSMLCYRFSEGGRIIVRPSGTEPKVKLYFEIVKHYPTRVQDRSEQVMRERESYEILGEFISSFKDYIQGV